MLARRLLLHRRMQLPDEILVILALDLESERTNRLFDVMKCPDLSV